MTQETEHKVFFTVLEDGSHLAASTTTPLFAFSGPSFEEVKAKSERALAFFAAHPILKPAHRQTRTVTPFAPSRVENLRVPAFAGA